MKDNIAQRLAELPGFLGGHMTLSLAALLVGLAISLPMGIWAVDRKRFRTAALTVASIIQTVPGLALLALMVPLLGGLIGFVPAFIALVLYSILPTLRNTITGISEVDPALIEAARGLGMTRRQILTRVQLPLAAPVIIAGVRTATVWVVGIATLSTPVGAPSLGNYIFMGLQTRNHVATLMGCVFAALLAIAFDQLIRLIERAVQSRSRSLGLTAGACLLSLILAGLAPNFIDFNPTPTPKAQGPASKAQPTPSQAKRTLSVGSKPFTEQYILAALLAETLSDEGYKVDKKANLGSTVAFDALRNNSLDAYVDYSGTIWATIMKRTDTASPEAVLIDVAHHLRAEYGVVCLGVLGFENAYALAMSRARAESLGVTTIADLAAHAGGMSIGGDYEFFGRAEWKKVTDTYGIAFKKQVGLDSTFMYGAAAKGEVDVIAAYSSDGRVMAFDLLVLKDPSQAFPPYDAILLLSPQAASDRGIVEALQPLVNAIGDDDMRWANKLVDVDKKSPEHAAGKLEEAIDKRRQPAATP